MLLPRVPRSRSIYHDLAALHLPRVPRDAALRMSDADSLEGSFELEAVAIIAVQALLHRSSWLD